jgi:hypothetical protein
MWEAAHLEDKNRQEWAHANAHSSTNFLSEAAIVGFSESKNRLSKLSTKGHPESARTK